MQLATSSRMRHAHALAIVFLVALLDCGKHAVALGEDVTDTLRLQQADLHEATTVLEEETGVTNDLGNPACGDANAATLELGSAALRARVESCVRSQPFGMVATAVQLLIQNIPVRFDLYNERPRGCVQMELTVEVVVSGAVTRSWLVIVDVDGKTDTQHAHYGYTIQGVVPKVAKETGHIFFPLNVSPPNVRPWKQSLGQRVSFTDQITPSMPNTIYRLKGVSYNQFTTQYATPKNGLAIGAVENDHKTRTTITTSNLLVMDIA